MPAELNRNPIRRAVRAILVGALALLLIAAFLIAVVMGQPQGEQQARSSVRTNQALLPALSTPVYYGSEDALAAMRGAFPAPWLTPQYAPMLNFRGATLESRPFENGHGRILTLTYTLDSGETVTIASIYPARALDLMGKQDYTISGTAGQTLGGLRSVRMENQTSIRLHAQGEEALYVVTVPHLDSTTLRQLTASLHLQEGK